MNNKSLNVTAGSYTGSNNNFLRGSLSSAASNEDYNFNDGVSANNNNAMNRGSMSNNNNVSHHSSFDNGTGNNGHIKQNTSTGQPLNFVIDDAAITTQISIDNEINNNHLSSTSHQISMKGGNDNNNLNSKKNKFTSKMKQISTSISTAIDKIQSGSYISNNRSLEAIPISSTMTSPSGANQSGAGSLISSTNNNILSSTTTTNSKPYQWNAPLQWKKVYVLKDFNATQQEIELIYNLFILEKESRGRVESILNYDDDNDDGKKNNKEDLMNIMLLHKQNQKKQ